MSAGAGAVQASARQKILVINAFCRVGADGVALPFTGNPAGVVLEAEEDGHAQLSDQQRQLIAREMRHSETAFVRSRPDGDFSLRWFSPTNEVTQS
jgi:PhzF family phenazine biosynthesis protein